MDKKLVIGEYVSLGAMPYFHERLAPDAVVFLDDAVRDDEQQIKEIWCREYSLKSTFVDTTHGLLRFERAESE